MTESEWDDQQAGWMLALTRWRASRCPNCGRDLEECGSGEWTVPPPRRCRVTDSLLLAQDNSNRPRPGALLWRVERR